MEKLKVLTPAKINLFLEVIGKRPDGFHNICSLVEKIEIFDEIEIFQHERNCVEFHGEWEIPENNTVAKVLEKLSSLFPLAAKKNPVKIVINKKIPPGSGLGGASSDAASVLKTLNKIWNLGLDMGSLVSIASAVGSDVALFLYNGTAIIEGKGEVVYPIKGLQPLSFILFVPDFQVSTKTVYEKLTRNQFSDLTQAREKIKIFLTYWKELDIEKMRKVLFNRLEEVVLKDYTEIGKIKVFLEERTGKRFILTGSGGGIYAIGSKNEFVTMNIPEIIRHWRCYKTKSFRESVEKEEKHGNY